MCPQLSISKQTFPYYKIYQYNYTKYVLLRQSKCSIFQGFTTTFCALRCVFRDCFKVGYIFSRSENRHFLKNALLPLLIYPVCQKFYILRKYVRAMKDILTGVSCISYAGGFYKMSCASPLSEAPILR